MAVVQYALEALAECLFELPLATLVYLACWISSLRVLCVLCVSAVT